MGAPALCFVFNSRKKLSEIINKRWKRAVNKWSEKRYDIVIFHPNGSINILIECKAPHISITQKTFDQIAQYNLKLDADLLMVTNGLQHYYCQMDFKEKRYNFLANIPNYKKI